MYLKCNCENKIYNTNIIGTAANLIKANKTIDIIIKMNLYLFGSHAKPLNLSDETLSY